MKNFVQGINCLILFSIEALMLKEIALLTLIVLVLLLVNFFITQIMIAQGVGQNYDGLWVMLITSTSIIYLARIVWVIKNHKKNKSIIYEC